MRLRPVASCLGGNEFLLSTSYCIGDRNSPSKRAGRHRFCRVDTALRDRVQRRLAIQSDLPHALSHEQLRLVYQPILCLETGSLVGCETLVRWNHPMLGPLSPAEFIPIAEDSGMIIALGDWVLRRACTQFARWRAESPDHAPRILYINLSRAQLVICDFDRRVARILEDCGVENERVHLEITETAAMRDIGRALRLARSLRRLGIKLELDDFGTGYSSLGSLHELPIDGIKIDRRFIQCLEGNERVLAVTEAVIALARRLGMTIVAEGIETERQHQVMRSLGCQFGQGFLFAAPLAPKNFAETFMAVETTAPIRY